MEPFGFGKARQEPIGRMFGEKELRDLVSTSIILFLVKGCWLGKNSN
jgi:hypothetical protein